MRGSKWSMGDYKKLSVWRKAHALSLNVNRTAGRMRRSQHAKLRNQIIGAAMSIPTNIVEGSGQKSDREFIRFLNYSFNSSRELEYHLTVARDLRVISGGDFHSSTKDLIEVQKMLYGFIAYLSKGDAKE